MKNILLIVCTAVILTACGSDSLTGPSGPSGHNGAAPDAQIRSALSDLGEITSVKASEWDGVYEVTINGQALYASADGSHFIAGDLYRADGRVNLTDIKRDDLRKQVLNDLAPEDSIVFAPEGDPKYVAWVFTDVDCAYCRRLHEHIAEYNDLGIEIRYLAFPRAGEGSKSWKESQSVWCADDRKSALTNAKKGAQITASTDCANAAAVAHGYAAGEAAGLRGTPMILDAEGRQLGGYLTPEKLLQGLKSSG